MFNMTKIRATNGAGKSFYANHLAANDYYSESEKVVGCWKGFLTYNFGLLGEKVDLNAFSLCGWPRKLDNLTWCKMPVKLTWKGRAFL